MSNATNGHLVLMPIRTPGASAEWDTDANLALLRQTYAKDLSEAEFALYIEHCRQLRLNPLTKQVQPLKFDGKTLSFHTTIHGLIAIAARSGTYAGMDAVRFDVLPRGDTLGNQHPNSASVTVYKLVGGQRCPYTAEVFWVERNRGVASWKSQPWTMLAKSAQAAALRLGWEEVQGLSIEEEMPAPVVESATEHLSQPEQAAPSRIPADQEPPAAPPTGMTWRAWCEELGKKLGVFNTLADYLKCFKEVTRVDPTSKTISIKTWHTWAQYLLNELNRLESLDKGWQEEDAGLAKMAGRNDVGADQTSEDERSKEREDDDSGDAGTEAEHPDAA